MRVYSSQILMCLKNQWIYKTNFILSLISPFLRVYISYIIWKTVIVGNPEYTDQRILIYLFLGGIFTLVFSSASIFTISHLIKSGTLPYLILKPVNLIWYLFSQQLGKVVLFIGGIITYYLIHLNFLGIIYFLLSFLTFSFIVLTMGATAFYLINVWPLGPLMSALILIFSGNSYPLEFLPERVFAIFRYNPFSLIFYQNIKFLQGDAVKLYLFIPLILWLIFFCIIAKNLLKKGLKKYEGYGL